MYALYAFDWCADSTVNPIFNINNLKNINNNSNNNNLNSPIVFDYKAISIHEKWMPYFHKNN